MCKNEPEEHLTDINELIEDNEPDEYLIEIMAEVLLSADEPYDFNAVSDIMGVAPTWTKTKDEFQIPEFASYMWQYDTGYQPSDDIGDQLAQLAKLFMGKREKIREYCEAHRIRVGFCVVIQSNSTQYPGLCIPRDFVEFASQLNAEIYFDIYCNSAHFA